MEGVEEFALEATAGLAVGLVDLYDGLRVEGGREGDAGTGPGGGDMVLLGGEGLEEAEADAAAIRQATPQGKAAPAKR